LWFAGTNSNTTVFRAHPSVGCGFYQGGVVAVTTSGSIGTLSEGSIGIQYTEDRYRLFANSSIFDGSISQNNNAIAYFEETPDRGNLARVWFYDLYYDGVMVMALRNDVVVDPNIVVCDQSPSISISYTSQE
jgi:hypothetical protein